MGSLISSMWMENQKKKIDKLFEDSSICELKQTCYFECVATQSGKHSYNNHPKSLTIGGREGRGAGGKLGGRKTYYSSPSTESCMVTVSITHQNCI